jgi:hypothetical protein
MRSVILAVGGTLVCSGCVAQPPPMPVFSEVNTKVVAADPSCQDYTARASIDAVQQEIAGRACQQPDGSWRVTEGTPGQTDKTIIVYVPPASNGSPYDPWLWGPPIGFSFGALVFVDREHRFHEFQFRHFASREHHVASREGGFREGGFRDGFHHGSEHGGMHGMHRG